MRCRVRRGREKGGRKCTRSPFLVEVGVDFVSGGPTRAGLGEEVAELGRRRVVAEGSCLVSVPHGKVCTPWDEAEICTAWLGAGSRCLNQSAAVPSPVDRQDPGDLLEAGGGWELSDFNI